MNLQIPDYRNAVIVAKSPASAKRYSLFTRCIYEVTFSWAELHTCNSLQCSVKHVNHEPMLFSLSPLFPPWGSRGPTFHICISMHCCVTVWHYHQGEPKSEDFLFYTVTQFHGDTSYIPYLSIVVMCTWCTTASKAWRLQMKEISKLIWIVIVSELSSPDVQGSVVCWAAASGYSGDPRWSSGRRVRPGRRTTLPTHRQDHRSHSPQHGDPM